MRSEESFFHETHQERIQKKPQHVQRSLNQRVLSPCLLSNGKRPLPRNPQRKHVQKNWVLCNGKEAVSTKPTKPKYTSKRSLSRSAWRLWVLCNGRQPFPRNPPKYTSKRSLSQSVWRGLMLCNGRQPFPRNPPRNTSRRSLNRSVWSPWLLCNGKEAFSTKPTKKHVQKKPKPEGVEPLVALQREGSLFHETHQETRPKEI